MRRLGSFMLVAVVLLSACSAAGGTTAPSAGASTGVATDLDGTTWDLTEMGGTAVAGGVTPTLVFGTGGMVSGLAGCNSFSGTATIGDGTIEFGPLATTRMACADEATTQLETDYLAALEGAATWAVEGEALRIGGSTELAYARV